jgi:putative acetyltransferase
MSPVPNTDLAMITICPEEPADIAQVREINTLAFAQPDEAALVDALRGVDGCISLVATLGGSIVGHIFFSPVHIDGPSSPTRAAGLGPMAVHPAHQRQGIGSQLVHAGLDACRSAGYQAVVVVGHPEFYPRFGFRPASTLALRCLYPVPDDVFMALELQPESIAPGGGLVRYRAEFDAL